MLFLKCNFKVWLAQKLLFALSRYVLTLSKYFIVFSYRLVFVYLDRTLMKLLAKNIQLTCYYIWWCYVKHEY